MKGFVIGVIATAIAFTILTKLLPQVTFTGTVPQLVLLAAVFGVVNGLIKPVVKLLSLPINMLTLGLFGLVVNTALFLLVAWGTNKFLDEPFSVAGFPGHGLTFEVIGTAFVASIALGLLTAVVGLVVHD